MGLDIVELVMEVEAEFRVDIPDEDASRLGTVGALYDYVARRLDPGLIDSRGGPYSGELWERYLDVVERESGAPRIELRPEARFVQDLRMD